MRLGGNEGWRKFYEQHESTGGASVRWDEGTDADRYTGEAGEEWKERLACKVEGKEYVPSEKKPAPPPKSGASIRQQSRSGTPMSGQAGSRNQSPGQGAGPGAPGKVKVDDQYFARLGADNASRPDNVHPNQGGKYAGFGNTPGPAAQNQGAGLSFDEVQKDPVAALTKGFGWFTTTVSKTAKNVNDGFIQPAAKNVSLIPPLLPLLHIPRRRIRLTVMALFFTAPTLCIVWRLRLCQASPAHGCATCEASSISWKECI